jgi:hypothetical protein
LRNARQHRPVFQFRQLFCGLKNFNTALTMNPFVAQAFQPAGSPDIPVRCSGIPSIGSKSAALAGGAATLNVSQFRGLNVWWLLSEMKLEMAGSKIVTI